jgi:hypothetical protein
LKPKANYDYKVPRRKNKTARKKHMIKISATLKMSNTTNRRPESSHGRTAS